MGLKRDPAKAQAWRERSVRQAQANARAKAKSAPSPRPSSLVKKPVSGHVTAPASRKSTLAPRSPKAAKVARRRAIADACRRALERDGRRCQGLGLLPGACWGPLDPQHVIPQGVRGDLAAVVENVAALCRGHHDYAGEHQDEANAVGLHGFSWDDPTELRERLLAARVDRGR